MVVKAYKKASQSESTELFCSKKGEPQLSASLESRLITSPSLVCEVCVKAEQEVQMALGQANLVFSTILIESLME